MPLELLRCRFMMMMMIKFGNVVSLPQGNDVGWQTHERCTRRISISYTETTINNRRTLSVKLCISFPIAESISVGKEGRLLTFNLFSSRNE